MSNAINLNVGEMIVCGNREVIRTVGIGSCVVVGIYCKRLQIGGLLHSMLPSAPVTENAQIHDKPQPLNGKEGEENKYYAKYVDQGLEDMIKLMIEAGANKNEMVAKMTGGATMLKFFGSLGNIGDRNVEMAHKKLNEHGIALEGEEVGGRIGRMAELNISNGILDVSTKM